MRRHCSGYLLLGEFGNTHIFEGIKMLEDNVIVEEPPLALYLATSNYLRG